jgi:hypothetical protein
LMLASTWGPFTAGWGCVIRGSPLTPRSSHWNRSCGSHLDIPFDNRPAAG